uniref:Uncharacterized protein n=1 Tax=Ditylenchus dipsaci TaxID=166011 RepID=A0A915CNH6_9BILA
MLTKSPSVRQRFYQEIENNVTTSTTQATKISRSTTLKHFSHKPLITTPTPISTTRKNFRKENDYYAMYYDG